MPPPSPPPRFRTSPPPASGGGMDPVTGQQVSSDKVYARHGDIVFESAQTQAMYYNAMENGQIIVFENGKPTFKEGQSERVWELQTKDGALAKLTKSTALSKEQTTTVLESGMHEFVVTAPEMQDSYLKKREIYVTLDIVAKSAIQVIHPFQAVLTSEEPSITFKFKVLPAHAPAIATMSFKSGSLLHAITVKASINKKVSPIKSEQEIQSVRAISHKFMRPEHGEFLVELEKDARGVGMTFKWDGGRQAVAVKAVEEVGTAARSKMIRIGDVVRGVQGERVDNLDFKGVIQKLRNVPMRVILVMEHAPLDWPGFPATEGPGPRSGGDGGGGVARPPPPPPFGSGAAPATAVVKGPPPPRPQRQPTFEDAAPPPPVARRPIPIPPVIVAAAAATPPVAVRRPIPTPPVVAATPALPTPVARRPVPTPPMETAAPIFSQAPAHRAVPMPPPSAPVRAVPAPPQAEAPRAPPPLPKPAVSASVLPKPTASALAPPPPPAPKARAAAPPPPAPRPAAGAPPPPTPAPVLVLASKNSSGDQHNPDKSIPNIFGAEYEKYVRMRRAGLPDGAVVNAMNRDTVPIPPGFFGNDFVAPTSAAPLKIEKKAPSSSPSPLNGGAGGGSIVDALKGFDANKLKHREHDDESNIEKRPSSGGGNLISEIASKAKSGLKKRTPEDIAREQEAKEQANKALANKGQFMFNEALLDRFKNANPKEESDDENDEFEF